MVDEDFDPDEVEIANPCGWEETNLYEFAFGTYQDKKVFAFGKDMEEALKEAADWLFDQDDAKYYTTSEEEMAAEFEQDTGEHPTDSEGAMETYMEWADGWWTERGWVDEWHYDHPNSLVDDEVRIEAEWRCEREGITDDPGGRFRLLGRRR